MSRPTRLVLDTTAVNAFVAGTHGIGDMLAEEADAGAIVVVPAICLSEAYRAADPEQQFLLDLLHNLESTHVMPVVEDDCALLGGLSRRVGRMDLAHAALASIEARIPIVTDDGDSLREALGKEWPIVDL